MNSSKTLQRRPTHRKVFTVADANATLPLVRAIVADLVELTREVVERRQRVSLLMGGKAPKQHDPYREELVQVDKDLEKDARRVREYIDELRALGVELANGPEGFVDFPAMLEGRKVFLCWKLGEPNVCCWHELDDSFQQCRPVSPDLVFQRDPTLPPPPPGGDVSQN